MSEKKKITFTAHFKIEVCKGPSRDRKIPLIYLDPCNCSSYYIVRYEPGYSETWSVCPRSLLWNPSDNNCDLQKNVDCDINAPWERCRGISDEGRSRMKRNCVQESSYPGSGDDKMRTSSEAMYSVLPRESQLANVELAFASLIAGSVITLMIVAMVMELCNCLHFRKIRTKAKKFTGKSKPRTVTGSKEQVIERDATVEYEYINENEVFQATLPNVLYPENASSTDSYQSVTVRQEVTQTSKTLEVQPLPSSSSSWQPSTMPAETMVPKTKSTPVKREKGGDNAKPSHQPLEHTESPAYIHPV